VSGESTRVVIGVEARPLRRVLGPSAWVVLEELLLRSVECDGERVAPVSVRALAVSAGLAKDTVARALGRLRAAGLVVPVQGRTAAGTFMAGRYRLAVPAHLTLTATSSADLAGRPCAVGRRGSTERADPAQLAFGIDG
jgi:hypothetical protein